MIYLKLSFIKVLQPLERQHFTEAIKESLHLLLNSTVEHPLSH